MSEGLLVKYKRRIAELEAELRHQTHMASKEYTRNLETQDKYQQLRTLSQAAVATGLDMGDITWVHTDEFDALAAYLKGPF
jgi:hypothetical protein